jgi:ankyrin repeat protein
MFETVRKGDIEAVKRIERRIGLDIQFLIDGNMKQNANFAAMKIFDEAAAIKMVTWLVGKGCQIKLTDDLNQTCLYYAARDGKTATVKCLLELGVDLHHVDMYG